MLDATLIAIAGFAIAALSVLANLTQVHEWLMRIFGEAEPAQGAQQTTNVFHVRSNAGDMGLSVLTGASFALTGENIVRHKDAAHVADNIIGDLGNQIPDLTPADDLATAGGGIFTGMADIDDMLP